MKKFSNKYLIITGILIAALIIFVFIYFFLAETDQISRYDFIRSFERARKVNFDLIKDSKIVTDDVMYSFKTNHIFNRINRLFARRAKMYESSGGEEIKISDHKFYNVAIRLSYYQDQKTEQTFRIKVKYIDPSNYHLITLKAERMGNIEVARFRDGKKNTIDSFNFSILNRKTNQLNIILSHSYIILLDHQRILFQMKEKDIKKVGFVLFGYNSGLYGERVKLQVVPIAGDFHKKIPTKNNIPYDRDHMFNIADRPWNKLFPEDKLVSENSDYLKRLMIDDTTRPSIYFKINSSLKYTAQTPENGVMQFYLAVSPDYVSDYNRLRFVTEIKDLKGDKLIRSRQSLSPLSNSKQAFYPVKIPLNELSGKDCEISFSFSTVDGKLIANEKKLVLAFASPMILSQCREDDINIILICLDTLRADHLGCYGYERDTSPNIDKFAQENTVFTTAVSTAPWTLPSHMSIFTSLYPYETGYRMMTTWYNVDNKPWRKLLKRQPDRVIKEAMEYRKKTRLSPNNILLAEFLQNAGYKTAASTGAGWVSSLFGFDRGFDFYKHSSLAGSADIAKDIDNVLSWLDENKDNKFFLFFHTFEIHSPYLRDYFYKKHKGEKLAKRQIAILKYDSGIRYADKHVNRLLEWLKEKNLYRKTIIIITSDHGENFDFIKEDDKPEGIHGSSLYDSELLVPLIIGGADVFKGGNVIQNQVSTVDIFPTIVDYLGLSVDEDIRGRSLMPSITDDVLNEKIAYAEGIHYLPYEARAVRSNRHKLIEYLYMKDKEKNIGKKEFELFDLREDKGEKNDIHLSRKDICERYKKYLSKIVKSIIMRRLKLEKHDVSGAVNTRELDEQLRQLGYIN